MESWSKALPCCIQKGCSCGPGNCITVSQSFRYYNRSKPHHAIVMHTIMRLPPIHSISRSKLVECMHSFILFIQHFACSFQGGNCTNTSAACSGWGTAPTVFGWFATMQRTAKTTTVSTGYFFLLSLFLLCVVCCVWKRFGHRIEKEIETEEVNFTMNQLINCN